MSSRPSTRCRTSGSTAAAGPSAAAPSAAAPSAAASLVAASTSPVAASGKVAGAVNIPRGLLEFRADPTSATHEAALDRGRTIVTYCAAGGRAALAAAVLKDMGCEDVRHMGGFEDWAGKGLPVGEG